MEATIGRLSIPGQKQIIAIKGVFILFLTLVCNSVPSHEEK